MVVIYLRNKENMKKRMNLKNALVLVLFVLLCLPFASCQKDNNDNTSDPVNPSNPTIYEDPEDAITANLRNDGGSISLLGTTLKINTANNFIGGDDEHTMTFVGIGEVSGLGYVCTFSQSGWSDQVAVTPGNGYVAKCIHDNRITYARLYVIRYILSTNNEILGAEIKYQDNWIPITISTNEVTNISSTAATCGGNVVGNGVSISKRGVCWSTSENPTIDDYRMESGSGDGAYSCNVSGLMSNTTYYIRAYAVCESGTNYGEQKTFTTQIGLPTVVTNGITGINHGSSCVCMVISDGGSAIIERGVCWSTSQNPTINDNLAVDYGNGLGEYTVQMTNMIQNTIYYIRAYAKNSSGISYGNEITSNDLLLGLFSIGSNQSIYFSKGNLQYQASTNTWRIAENQFDYVGLGNSNISPSYSGWIDLFGWGTGNNPTNISGDPYDYNYFYDWGDNNISNGNGNNWRTLTYDEMSYVVNTRNTASGIRFAKATIDGICGVILLPDNWNSSLYNLINTNNGEVDYSVNTMALQTWLDVFEQNGAVFLPAAGYRGGRTVYEVGLFGAYYLNYYSSDGYGGALCFRDCFCYVNTGGLGFGGVRSYGACVRLVRNVE